MASASSGPMPSPGIRVTRWAMRSIVPTRRARATAGPPMDGPAVGRRRSGRQALHVRGAGAAAGNRGPRTTGHREQVGRSSRSGSWRSTMVASGENAYIGCSPSTGAKSTPTSMPGRASVRRRDGEPSPFRHCGPAQGPPCVHPARQHGQRLVDRLRRRRADPFQAGSGRRAPVASSSTCTSIGCRPARDRSPDAGCRSRTRTRSTSHASRRVRRPDPDTAHRRGGRTRTGRGGREPSALTRNRPIPPEPTPLKRTSVPSGPAHEGNMAGIPTSRTVDPLPSAFAIVIDGVPPIDEPNATLAPSGDQSPHVQSVSRPMTSWTLRPSASATSTDVGFAPSGPRENRT